MAKYMKGQILNTGVSFIMALVFIGILVGVGLITLTSMQSGQTGNTLAGLTNATAGMTNISTQLPTVGTIMGVGLILIVVFTAFGYFMRR